MLLLLVLLLVVVVVVINLYITRNILKIPIEDSETWNVAAGDGHISFTTFEKTSEDLRIALVVK
jgi:preprotein translocase subunit SecY